jgi:hypothetical protein
MSGFKRSKSGLGNQYLFYKVDLVVFLEGGKISYNIDEVYQGKYNSVSNDIIFWSNIFKCFMAGTKIKFKTIKEIATIIISGALKTVMVAMDNDFDEILNKQFKHSNILYTCGYSWENDLWNEIVIKDVIEELSAEKILSDDIEINFLKFLKTIKIGVIADCYLFHKNSSFFQRSKGYMSCINCESSDLPHVKNVVIEKNIKKTNLNKSTLYSFGRRKAIDPRKHCYGHLYADYCYQLIMHYLKNKLDLPGIKKELIYRMGLKKYFDNHFEKSYLYNFYQSQFTSIV